MASTIVLAPLVLVWCTKRLPRLDARRVAELIGLVILLALLCQFLFGDWLSSKQQGPLALLVGPMLLWPALRFGQRGTTLTVLILVACATLGTLRGTGPLATQNLGSSLLLLQEFIGVVAALALMLAAEVAQRQRADNSLRKSERRYRELADLGRRLSTAHSPKDAAWIIVEAADRLFGWDSSTVSLYSAEEDTLHTVLYFDVINGQRQDVSAQFLTTQPSARTTQVLREGAKLILRPEPPAFSPDAKPYGDVARPSASLMYVPLRMDETMTGILSIQSYTPNAYTEDDLRALQALADHCAGALERIRAEEALMRLNAELQQRVQERTGQLETLNLQLEQRTAQLEALNKELESFSYTVSHDLRAPLRSIRGFSEAVLERYAAQLDPRGQEFLHRACESSQRMEILIEDLLKLSRLGRGELRPRFVDLSLMAESIADDLRKTEPERKAEFVIAPGLKARGDEHLLRVALDNLLRNAWKFTGKQPRARIEFGATAQPAKAFYVRDNGAGFDMQYASQLFGVFHRLHTASEFPGHGVGLATVQRIVNRHGGRVWAEGAIDQGATFYFALPYNGSS
jgi:signal transduction histidine kinase